MEVPELPYDTDAERAVLAALLTSPDAAHSVAHWLRTDMFYRADHQAMYDAMLSLYKRHAPIDVRTLASELRQRGTLEAAGGIAGIADVAAGMGLSSRVTAYADTVAKAALHRNVVHVSTKIAALGYNTTLGADELRAEVSGVIAEVLATRERDELVSLGTVLDELYELYGSEQRPGIATGFYDYDGRTGGLYPGKLYILAGRPGHGKSAFATSLAMNMAQAGRVVDLYSMEMHRLEVGQRLIAMQSHVDSTALQRNEIDADDLARVFVAMNAMRNWPIFMSDVGVTLADIRARCARHLAERGQIDLVIVDYLQLVKVPARRNDNRALAVAEIARGLKELAMELQVPVLALSQLNREIEHRADPMPTLADLRESGEIEQAADQVLFIVRPELFDSSTSEKGVGMLHIAKNRSGPQSTIKLKFDAPRTRYDNYSGRAPEGY